MKPALLLSISLLGAFSFGCATDYEATSERSEVPVRAHPNDKVYMEHASPEELAALDTFHLFASAQVPSATGVLGLVKSTEGIDEKYRGHIAQIRSERSTLGMEPTVWHVVYLDPSKEGQPIEVKFSDGQLASRSELAAGTPVSDRSDEIDMTKVSLDSEAALERAIQESGFGQDTIGSTAMRLENGADGPVWTVQFWGVENKDDTELGEVSISATNGTVVKP